MPMAPPSPKSWRRACLQQEFKMFEEHLDGMKTFMSYLVSTDYLNENWEHQPIKCSGALENLNIEARGSQPFHGHRAYERN